MLLGDPAALLSAIVLLIIGVAAVLPDLFTTMSPIAQDLRASQTPPFDDPRHLLGTDALGRDLWSRVVHGSSVSLTIALLTVLLSGGIGTLVGLISGYRRGIWDSVLMRVADIQLAFPALVLAVAIMSVVGPGLGNVIIVLAVNGWVLYARVIRAEVLALRGREFIEAARAIGCRDRRIILRHVLPNVTASVLVLASFNAAQVILAESTLSFLGIGVPPPTPSWGSMISDGRQYLATGWWISTVPALALMVTLLCFNVLGDWIRDRLDPRLQIP
jgi:peptide/nickel transport system permease protein